MILTSYKNLVVWQKSMDLVVRVYQATKLFPDEERFGLISQMRRCAVSIPSNIAEGKNRGSRKDFRNFLHIAYGSSAELETQLEISRRLGFLKDIEFEELGSLLKEVLKMLNVFIAKL